MSRMQDKKICPVFAVERNVQEANLLGINLKTGYLFRTLDSRKKIVTYGPHGLRGACAISLTFSGASSDYIM